MNNDLYRAFWRWHFYAGLIALPFLVWLAVTGGLYLFKPEVERAVYGSWITLSSDRSPVPASTLIARVQDETGGKVAQVERPASARESWRMRYLVAARSRTAFVDPADGKVLGTTTDGGIAKTIRDLHSLAITGKLGNVVIEVAAGWAIILMVTGVVLWWPRQGQPAFALRPPTRSRRFWRDLHASTGALAGLIVLFLATTGMPWSVFWGANVQKMLTANGLGRPSAPVSTHGEHQATAPTGALRESLPWSLQAAPMPHAHGVGDVGVDRVVAIASQRGLAAPYTITLPASADKPYTVSKVARAAEEAHTIFIDPASGTVLKENKFGDFGAGSRVIEWGVSTHQGLEYAPINRWVMLAGCIGILLLAASAPVLWWKRRDAGRLVRPPRPRDNRRIKVGTAVAAVLGVIYPLTGLTVLAVLLFDIALQRRKTSAATT
ncbi:MAG: PepSY domain-containing protein [Sphingomonas sp.]|nr:PepSY domain-containing protein [Sphingomonas sp.]